MPIVAYTVALAKILVYARLKGKKLVDDNIGELSMEAAISAAEQVAITDAPFMELAGSLGKVAALTAGSGGIVALPSDCLVPKFWSPDAGKAVRVSVSKLAQSEKTDFVSGRRVYAFVGQSLHVRPAAAASGSIYYVAVPTNKSGLPPATTQLEVSPMLFGAIVTKASSMLLSGWAGASIDELMALEQDYANTINRLRSEFGDAPMSGYAAETGRSPLSGPGAAGSGIP